MNQQELLTLKATLQGELHWDRLHQGLYATDASIYQILPSIVAIPKSVSDLQNILAFCRKHNISIVPRGAGTSLAGQTVGKGLVIDFNKYFNDIIAINEQEKFAIVQPGVYRDSLNLKTKKYNLHFAPDPATSSRATFGGMIANNSSGTRSIVYGKTIDHIISLDIMTINGEIITLKESDIDALSNDENSQLIKKIRPVIFQNTQEIIDAYPKVMRRVSGYALDEFVNTTLWNLSKLICGSEGTLALILSAKIKLTDLPVASSLSILHFKDRHSAIASVPIINNLGPAAVELLDYNVLNASKANSKTFEYHKSIITGNPEAVLFVEFFGENEKQLNLKNRLLEGQVSEIKSCYHNFYTKDSELINNAIKLRKDGLGLIMNQVTSIKPLAFIEDSAIPLEYLSEYVSAIEDYCNQINVNLVLYAHASVGVLHIRPYLDLHKEEEIEKLQNISAYAFSLVKKYGGSWSGEHGDGRVRSPQLKEYYGEKIYNAWVDVKNIFDPKGLLNPGIIIEPNDITQDLKVNPRLHQKKINTTFKYRKEGSFGELINNCTGIGACVKHNVGTMCPSYMATHDEKDSTRGRANILRLSINGELHNKDITTKEAEDALALCLSCKACKSECPSNVDVAKLKSEYLQLKYIKKGISPLEWSIRKSDLFSRRFSGKFAGIINKIQHSAIARKLIERVIGIDQRRILPDYSNYTLVDWYEKNYKSVKDGIAVALFCDTYINYHEPHIGKAAINLLNEAGYNVLLANVGCCQRPKISNGFLKDAKELGNETILGLLPYFEKNIPVVVCEPSCTSALIDDLPDLIDDESLAEYAKNNVYQIENFIISQIEAGIINKTLKYKAKDVLIQNHCHAQALWDNHQIDSTIESEKVNCPDVGCCGMAGSFGYEKVRYDVSRRIYENRLGPSLKANEDSTIVSNGFSCRHQIKDFGRKSAIHWVEAVEWI